MKFLQPLFLVATRRGRKCSLLRRISLIKRDNAAVSYHPRQLQQQQRANMSITRKFIRASGPSSLPYSPAVLVDHTLYVSGQLGTDPKTSELVPGGIAAETKQAMENMGALLKKAGVNYDAVVKATIILADIKEFDAMNDVYKTYFKEGSYPARMAYQVAGVPKGGRVEIEAIAVVGDVKNA